MTRTALSPWSCSLFQSPHDVFRCYWFLIFKSTERREREVKISFFFLLNVFLRNISWDSNGIQPHLGFYLPADNLMELFTGFRSVDAHAAPPVENDHQSRKRGVKIHSILMVFWMGIIPCSRHGRPGTAAAVPAPADATRAPERRGRPEQNHPHRLRAAHAPPAQLRQPLATSAHECNRTQSPLHAASVSNR